MYVYPILEHCYHCIVLYCICSKLSVFSYTLCSCDTSRQVRRKREDNIKMDLMEMWCKGVDWMHLTQDRLQ